MKKIILLLVVYFFLITKIAYAYIDPGAGSSLFQIIAGSFLMVGLFWKLFWIKVKHFFKKKEPENDNK